MSTDYEIFNCAEANNHKKLKALLDAGVDPNVTDYDRGAPPLMYACNKGHIESIEILIDYGADVNLPNKRGRTPIHALIEMRFFKIVLWLIKYCGGDVHKADSRGLTPYDLAPQFMQKEIDECLASIGQVDTNPAVNQPAKTTPQPAAASSSTSSQSDKAGEVVVYKIHLPNRSYKSVKTTTTDAAENVLENLCEKLNLNKDCARFLTLFERVKDRERRVKNTELIADIVKMWPMILGESGNETNKHCYFMAAPLSTAPDYVLAAMS
jgi:hypothetical protein